MNLQFSNIGHSYGSVQALADINLELEAGEICCLLGPSGCGKTTLLHLAAGLRDVQQGEIRAGGEVMAASGINPPPEKRPVGLVFQEGALFPHMSLAGNIGFGVEDKAQKAARVAEWLGHIGLTGMGDRYPDTLSGGQQQRVALARAMAAEPAILLMDEPFANIDVVLRKELRQLTRRLLQERGTSAIIVTHDPAEAIDMGDRIAVMEAGVIAQHGTPDDLFDAPATAAIGAMIGGGQIVPAVRDGDVLKTAFGLWPMDAIKGDVPEDGARLELLVPQTALKLAQGEALRVVDVRRSGTSRMVSISAENGDILDLEIAADSPPKRGDGVALTCKKGEIAAFPA